MDSSMTCWICCGGRPPGGKFLVPRRGRAPRRYLSDKQRTPRSRGAKHVAKCGPKVLTPKWVRGTPLREPVHRAERDGGKRASWRLQCPGYLCKTARLQEWIRPFLRATHHLQTQISPWRQEDTHMSVLVIVFSSFLAPNGIL